MIAPVWQNQAWYPTLLQMLVSSPVLLPETQDILTSPRGEHHPMAMEGHLPLATWPISVDSKVFISLTWCLSPSGPSCHQLPNFDFCQNLFYLKELYNLRMIEMILTSDFLTGPCCATIEEYCLFFALPLNVHSTWQEAQQIDHPDMCKSKFKFISRRNRVTLMSLLIACKFSDFSDRSHYH